MKNSVHPKSQPVFYSRLCVDQLEVVIFVSPRFLDRITPDFIE